ncbi:hypothetical protein J5N97_015406 [Dioscorea zingiberensis]|uniref:Uncharacterized protein n=1 Tax=Dioscorea zingiberensis TaxID=325984 RepID=A0A9D5CWG8_9LILI|nr:hypothetical protein J5N97_015406 [Dioscorea zingiberensis]
MDADQQEDAWRVQQQLPLQRSRNWGTPFAPRTKSTRPSKLLRLERKQRFRFKSGWVPDQPLISETMNSKETPEQIASRARAAMQRAKANKASIDSKEKNDNNNTNPNPPGEAVAAPTPAPAPAPAPAPTPTPLPVPANSGNPSSKDEETSCANSGNPSRKDEETSCCCCF